MESHSLVWSGVYFSEIKMDAEIGSYQADDQGELPAYVAIAPGEDGARGDQSAR